MKSKSMRTIKIKVEGAKRITQARDLEAPRLDLKPA
jgi:hypothetical protein